MVRVPCSVYSPCQWPQVAANLLVLVLMAAFSVGFLIVAVAILVVIQFAAFKWVRSMKGICPWVEDLHCDSHAGNQAEMVIVMIAKFLPKPKPFIRFSAIFFFLEFIMRPRSTQI